MRITQVMKTVIALLLAGLGVAAFAQGKLAISEKKPSVDGVIQTGEYSYSQDFDQQMTLYASRTSMTLYLGVVANTSGWVAVGLGTRMDGADIFIGYIKDGKVYFKPQVGSGHSHHDASASVDSSLVSYALGQRGGKTTLEIALKAGAYIKDGQSKLDLIFAMGDQPSFSQYHSYRNLTSLTLQ